VDGRVDPATTRYLTTVILKHFPQYKTKFTRFAKAKTIAPDEWKVLRQTVVSQPFAATHRQE
jgi:hypothetical protein